MPVRARSFQRISFHLTLWFVIGCFSNQATADESLVQNDNFERWNDLVPEGGEIEIGAKNGAETPVSEIKRIAGPALMLRGDARTMAWKSLGQDVALTPGKTYSLSFQASAKGIKREGRQFDNCYVGVMHFDASGKRLDMAIKDLSRVTRWQPQAIRFTTPAESAKSTLSMFLSKSGSLKMKDVSLQEATPEKPFR
jgi:hypothetical protein